MDGITDDRGQGAPGRRFRLSPDDERIAREMLADGQCDIAIRRRIALRVDARTLSAVLQRLARRVLLERGRGRWRGVLRRGGESRFDRLPPETIERLRRAAIHEDVTAVELHRAESLGALGVGLRTLQAWLRGERLRHRVDRLVAHVHAEIEQHGLERYRGMIAERIATGSRDEPREDHDEDAS